MSAPIRPEDLDAFLAERRSMLFGALGHVSEAYGILLAIAPGEAAHMLLGKAIDAIEQMYIAALDDDESAVTP